MTAALVVGVMSFVLLVPVSCCFICWLLARGIGKKIRFERQMMLRVKPSKTTGAGLSTTNSKIGKIIDKEAKPMMLAHTFFMIKSASNQNHGSALVLMLVKLGFTHPLDVLKAGIYSQEQIVMLFCLAQPRMDVVLNNKSVHFKHKGIVEQSSQTKEELAQTVPTDSLTVWNADNLQVI